MIRIDWNKTKNSATPESQENIIKSMMLNAYNQGLIAGETRAYRKVIDLLHAQEVRFLSILDRRSAQRPDPAREVEILLAHAGKDYQETAEGGIKDIG